MRTIDALGLVVTEMTAGEIVKIHHRTTEPRNSWIIGGIGTWGGILRFRSVVLWFCGESLGRRSRSWPRDALPGRRGGCFGSWCRGRPWWRHRFLTGRHESTKGAAAARWTQQAQHTPLHDATRTHIFPPAASFRAAWSGNESRTSPEWLFRYRQTDVRAALAAGSDAAAARDPQTTRTDGGSRNPGNERVHLLRSRGS